MNGNASNLWVRILMALVFFAVGAGIVLVAVGGISVEASAFRAPRLVVGLMGAAFMAGGVLLLTLEDPSLGELPLPMRWAQYGALVVFMGAFSLITLWWGFLSRGTDEVTLLGFVTLHGKAGVWLKRLLIGGFGIVLTLATLWVALTEPLRLLGLWRRQ